MARPRGLRKLAPGRYEYHGVQIKREGDHNPLWVVLVPGEARSRMYPTLAEAVRHVDYRYPLHSATIDNSAPKG